MQSNLRYLKDVLSMNYIGISIQIETVMPYLDQLKEILADKFEAYVGNQKNRDLGSYHINVITSSEYNSLSEKGVDKFINSLESFFDKPINLTLLGLGKAQQGNSVEFFVIVKSDDLQSIRNFYKLPEKDFCITLGFYPREVFGVRKNILVPLKDPFLKLLSQNYYNHNQSFEFLREFPFFEGDPNKDIEVIKLEDTFGTFRVEQNYFNVSLLGDALGISAKWQETKNKPILSDTIVSRKLKNI